MKSVRASTHARTPASPRRRTRRNEGPLATDASSPPLPARPPLDVSSRSEDEGAAGAEPSDLAPVVGTNLRRLRTQRRLSLEKLSQRSGVSRAMLGQIELGQSAPTINVLWKIARALDVTFATLIQTREAGGTTVLKKTEAKVLTSRNGVFSSRALFPFDGPRRAELYELRLAAAGTEAAEAHAPGTVENLVVVEGQLELTLARSDGADEAHRLGAGDAILFEADVPHAYTNLGPEECVMYLVMTYAERNA